jgi:hypothetical protein
MSVVLLRMKDQAPGVIRKFQLRAEAETGEKLGGLHTEFSKLPGALSGARRAVVADDTLLSIVEWSSGGLQCKCGGCG